MYIHINKIISLNNVVLVNLCKIPYSYKYVKKTIIIWLIYRVLISSISIASLASVYGMSMGHNNEQIRNDWKKSIHYFLNLLSSQ